MDDGFQHMALNRECNIVLFSASELLGNGRVFPGGPLREPFSALRRADAFVITGADPVDSIRSNEFIKHLADSFPGKPVFRGMYRPVGLQKVQETKIASPENCRELSFFAFCGIANPESFHNSLKKEDIAVRELLTFADHHSFTGKDKDTIERRAAQAGCNALVTTAKDYVKLQAFSFQIPLWILKVELDMEAGFEDYLFGKLTH
jgi:tetraacyldisaccharide 4'-kinase